MRLPFRFAWLLAVAVHVCAGAAATKIHVITFGKPVIVQWLPERNRPGEEETVTLKVRPLMVDGRTKEFTLGSPHEVTDRLFVVRRAFRVNDSLPQESGSPPHWQWQQGGWILVDRITGHVSAVNLPEFDAFYSVVSWYRDYAAYCGVSEDGKKVFAMVAEIGRRRAILRKELREKVTDENADVSCFFPSWQRLPARVTFEAAGLPKETFVVRDHVVGLLEESEEE